MDGGIKGPVSVITCQYVGVQCLNLIYFYEFTRNAILDLLELASVSMITKWIRTMY